MVGMRLIMLIGIAATPVAYVVFSRLLSLNNSAIDEKR